MGCGEPSVDIWETAKVGNIESVKKYLDAKDKYEWTGLSWAAAEGQNEIVDLLIAKGADVNAKGELGTPLDCAIVCGHKEIAELLIAEGADVNVKIWDGSTPLDFAIEEDETQIADLLRKHGAKTAEELKAEGK